MKVQSVHGPRLQKKGSKEGSRQVYSNICRHEGGRYAAEKVRVCMYIYDMYKNPR